MRNQYKLIALAYIAFGVLITTFILSAHIINPINNWQIKDIIVMMIGIVSEIIGIIIIIIKNK
ncbi:MAG: hypothetical protein IJW74_05755 [Oscillospiraceae bacterium]|nr:hypothetical protein [Oscillospiraceae bacterium]